MKTFLSVIIWGIGILLGILGSIGGFLGAGFLVSNITILCVIALGLGFLIIFAMGKLAIFVLCKKSNNRKPIIVASIIMILLTAFCSFTVFKPLPGPIMKADKPENTKFWQLSTGSHIAYWHYAAQGVKKSTPIIFLHGGPGAFTRDLERDFFSKFTKNGYDVYLYDQPGAGFSDNLNMDEYTISRYVEDIEAIRKEIGAEKVILIGQSFGGILESRYVTTYPNNVEKLIFTCPAALGNEYPQKESKEPRNAGEFIKPFQNSFAESLRLRALIFLDRNINKHVGENLISQKEITDYTTRITYEALAQSFPPSYVDKIPKIKSGGLNFHANIMLQADFQKESNNIRKEIKEISVPVLILRGEYDYIPWENTREYRELYPNSKLVYIKDSGHILWAVNEKDTYSTINEFILNKELTLPDYTDKEDPSTI